MVYSLLWVIQDLYHEYETCTEEEEEEENGPQALLRPTTPFPPSISEQLRCRHRRSPRGVREGE